MSLLFREFKIEFIVELIKSSMELKYFFILCVDAFCVNKREIRSMADVSHT